MNQKKSYTNIGKFHTDKENFIRQAKETAERNAREQWDRENSLDIEKIPENKRAQYVQTYEADRYKNDQKYREMVNTEVNKGWLFIGNSGGGIIDKTSYGDYVHVYTVLGSIYVPNKPGLVTLSV